MLFKRREQVLTLLPLGCGWALRGITVLRGREKQPIDHYKSPLGWDANIAHSRHNSWPSLRLLHKSSRFVVCTAPCTGCLWRERWCRRIRLFPALHCFSHRLFFSFSCVVCLFNLQAQFPFRLVYRGNYFVYIIYTIYSVWNADCN